MNENIIKIHFFRLRLPGPRPRIAKNDKMSDAGEYKIRPYKRFPGEGRGEPCVHPALSDRLPEVYQHHTRRNK